MVRALNGLKGCNGVYLILVCGLILLAGIYFTVQMEEHLPQLNNCTYAEPIDIVYTWVNGSDQLFIQEINRYMNMKANIDSSKQRYEDKNELRFSLRSLEKFAPWINHVYLVTNGQIPYWLNLDYDKISVITHDMIFKDGSNLPTFSSPAIESNLHRIPGLSKRFIYFNDDIFVGKQLYLEDFLSPNTGFSVFLAYALPNCAPRCLWLYVADGQCDMSCNVPNCQFDGGDCAQEHNRNGHPSADIELGNWTRRTEHTPMINTSQMVVDEYSTRNIGIRLLKAQNGSIFKLVNEHNKKVLVQNKKLGRRKRYLRKDGYSTGIEGKHFMKNIDGFLTSLQYTQRVFNKKYGFMQRYVPAHAPILIDRDIMLEMERTFPTEFQITERNRFRHVDDMQFGFSYYYFLMSETITKSVDTLFDEFDTDRSGTWSDREIRNLLTKLYKLPLSYEIVDHFEVVLLNCSGLRTYPEVPTPLHERYIDSKLPTISKETVVNCPSLGRLLEKKLGHVPKYKHKVIKNAESSHATFKMLVSNITNVVINLDEIRSKMTKFVCINDNLLEWALSENELIKALLYDFYLSLFPHHSQFELPDHSRNRFIHMKQLLEWRRHRDVVKIILTLAIISLILVTFFNSFKKRCCKVINQLFC